MWFLLKFWSLNYRFRFYSPYSIEACKQILLSNSDKDTTKPTFWTYINTDLRILVAVDEQGDYSALFKMKKSFGRRRRPHQFEVIGKLEQIEHRTLVTGHCSPTRLEQIMWFTIIPLLIIAVVVLPEGHGYNTFALSILILMGGIWIFIKVSIYDFGLYPNDMLSGKKKHTD
jgi:hypothetical protein